MYALCLYWVRDFCEHYQIEFILGHALNSAGERLTDECLGGRLVCP